MISALPLKFFFLQIGRLKIISYSQNLFIYWFLAIWSILFMRERLYLFFCIFSFIVIYYSIWWFIWVEHFVCCYWFFFFLLCKISKQSRRDNVTSAYPHHPDWTNICYAYLTNPFVPYILNHIPDIIAFTPRFFDIYLWKMKIFSAIPLHTLQN